MAVSRRLRYEILRRDGHTCRYCGGKAPDVALTVDHVVPVSLGGTDEPVNLVAACADCNGGKSSVPADAPLVEQVAEDALRWGRAMKLAAEYQDDVRCTSDDVCNAFYDGWTSWTYGSDGHTVPLPSDWRQSVEHFVKVGLEPGVIYRAVARAMEKRGLRGDFAEFTYMCGILWRTLDERQRIAREALDAGMA